MRFRDEAKLLLTTDARTYTEYVRLSMVIDLEQRLRDVEQRAVTRQLKHQLRTAKHEVHKARRMLPR